jgi:dTMP kinase
MSGRFIVIEGIDGSGKGTQLKRLAEFLRQHDKDVITTFEPTDEGFGAEINMILREHTEIDPTEFQMLYVKDREAHLKNVIKPALEEGKIVLCDRYALSTLAFGSIGGADLGKLKEAGVGFLVPEMTIFIDVTPEECMNRIEKRGEEQELFEKLEKLKIARETYLKEGENYSGFKIVDGNRSREEIFEDIKRLVLGLF